MDSFRARPTPTPIEAIKAAKEEDGIPIIEARIPASARSVSYTHLDVYKRQI